MKRLNTQFSSLIIAAGVLGYLLFLYACQSGKSSVQPAGHSTDQHEYSLAIDTGKIENSAEMKLLDSAIFNFGAIRAGDTVIHSFSFKNVGKKPVIISGATATCGCTVASFNKRPIVPGQTDSIVAVFISNKKNKGFVSKVVTVNYNSGIPKLLTLYGNVE